MMKRGIDGERYEVPVGIGRCPESVTDGMILEGKKGRAVIMIHSYLDELWNFGSWNIEPNYENCRKVI